MADEDGELDYDMLDGYEDLGDDDRAKVRQALKDGHVADEDALGANKPSVQAEQTSLKQSVKEAKNEVKKLQTAVDKARNKGDEDAEEKATKSLKAATTHLADVEQSLEASLKISQVFPPSLAVINVTNHLKGLTWRCAAHPGQTEGQAGQERRRR